MSKVNISRIILFVADIKNMTEFYHQIIGLAIHDDREPGFISLAAGSCHLSLHSLPGKIAGQAKDVKARKDSYIKFVFYAENVESERERLSGLGVVMIKVIKFGISLFVTVSIRKETFFRLVLEMVDLFVGKNADHG